MNARAIPFHCPYCGEEDLRPHETEEGSPHGTWECRACRRAFRLSMLGMLRSPAGQQTEQARPGGAR